MMQIKFNFIYYCVSACHSLAACQQHTPSSLAAVIGLSNNDAISLRSLRCVRCVWWKPRFIGSTQRNGRGLTFNCSLTSFGAPMHGYIIPGQSTGAPPSPNKSHACVQLGPTGPCKYSRSLKACTKRHNWTDLNWVFSSIQFCRFALY